VPWIATAAVVASPVANCFADDAMTVKVDLASRTKRLQLLCEPSEVTFAVVAELVPAVGGDWGMGDESMLLLGADGSAVVALQSRVSRGGDGVVQIAGGEAGIALVTAGQFQAKHRGQRVFESVTLRSIRPEVLSEAVWAPAPLSFSLPAGAAGRMTVTRE
jgi:hypothetical protein